MAPLPLRILSALGLSAGLGVAALAQADEAPTCRPFDNAPACCPHPPPQCCEPVSSRLLDEASVLELCGGLSAKGEKAAFGACNRYFARGDRTVEVIFGREPGDAAAFDKRKSQLGGATARISAATVAQAQKAFWVREVDETGTTARSALWALVGKEIVHVYAEHVACGEDAVMKLLVRAIERMRQLPGPRG